MLTSLTPDIGVVQYFLPLGDQYLPLNPLIGKTVSLEFSGTINCVACDRKIKKTYQQGHCFPCMQSLAACDTCIVKPETCHYAQGTCREPSWGEEHCFIPHTVYLSNSSGLKVGITRRHQRLTRWIDQGAIQAIPLLDVNDRLSAGKVEVALKKSFNDRTNWRKMLSEDVETLDLHKQREAVLQDFTSAVPHEIAADDPVSIRYPVNGFPEKIKSHNLDKQPLLEGQLIGIKGQYLIFAHAVINMRKYGGYQISVKHTNNELVATDRASLPQSR